MLKQINEAKILQKQVVKLDAELKNSISEIEKDLHKFIQERISELYPNIKFEWGFDFISASMTAKWKPSAHFYSANGAYMDQKGKWFEYKEMLNAPFNEAFQPVYCKPPISARNLNNLLKLLSDETGIKFKFLREYVDQ